MNSQHSGFALLRHPAPLVHAFAAALPEQDRSFYSEFRKSLRPHDPCSYRGVSREPLTPADSGHHDPRFEIPARALFRQIVGQHEPSMDFSEDLLPTLALAEKVRSLLSDPTAYETVELRRPPLRPDRRALGYDIGYWSGDHFSLICDSAVMPHWHGPDPASFPSVAVALRWVNEFFLFPTAATAEQYAEFYRSQPWAETEFEPGEFCVIQVLGTRPAAWLRAEADPALGLLARRPYLRSQSCRAWSLHLIRRAA